MPSIFAANAEGSLSPSFDLRCLKPGQRQPDGWGIGFYPGDASYGAVLKETPSAAPTPDTAPQWSSLESSTFIVHLRRASWGGLVDSNTQPFKRAYARRAWMFAHSGDLDRRLELADDARFEPVGTSDSETLFCALMNRLTATGARSLGDVDSQQIAAWFEELGAAGDVTSVWSDGRDLVAYRGRGAEELYLTQLVPPVEQLAVSNEAIAVDFTVRGALLRRCAILSSTALSGAEAVPLANGELVVIREGAVIHRAKTEQNVVPLAPSTLRPVVKRPERMESKVLSVVHRTVYEYEQPVHRSEHLLRLTPVDDRRQNLLDHRLILNVNHRGV
ncbi:MAG: class II glutamine amidotransferase, partial [Myxococcota bacterium]